MPEIRTVTTLRRKQAEISASLRLYEKKLEQAHADWVQPPPIQSVIAGTEPPMLGPRGLA